MSDPLAIRRRHFLARAFGLLAGGAWLGGKAATREAAASIQVNSPYTGEIKMFAGDFAPFGWAFCSGQLLPIAQYEQLFFLIGTTYGGDGVVSFGLPDLRSRAPLHVGPASPLGQAIGQETTTLVSSQIPAHTHALMASSAVADSNDPSGRVPARSAAGAPHYAGSVDTNFNANSMAPSGGSQPHNNMMPSLAINFIICLEGVFPSQS